MKIHDEQWMQQALVLANYAAAIGEVPVGAVIIADENIIGEGWNSSITNNDPTAHAEIQALRAAAQKIANYRLVGTTLYSTLEPCLMCAGAMLHARISRLVFATYDYRSGAISQFNLLQSSILNHQISWETGILQQESIVLLKSFFKLRRKTIFKAI